MAPSSSPVPFWMARLMLSAGMLTLFALSTAVRRRGLEAGSPPPMRAAIDISRMILVKIFPRLASRAPFLCLIDAHLECPDMRDLLGRGRCYHKRKSPDGIGRSGLRNQQRAATSCRRERHGGLGG